MMVFHTLIEKTMAVFAGLSCQQLELPNQFAKIERHEQDGVLAIENHFFKIGDVGQLRIAHTHAPKINIIAVFFFPEYAYQLPVYSMEFVLLGQKPIIALMDTACLIQPMMISTVVNDLMDAAHTDYPEFSQGEALPQWFDECRSGHEFFIRPREISEFSALGEIHLSLIGQLTKLFQNADGLDKKTAALHKTHLENYKHHHKINSPGTRLMNRSFGEEWTNEYLTAYLFS
jgi:Ferredoxin-dependent bilin reductase